MPPTWNDDPGYFREELRKMAQAQENLNKRFNEHEDADQKRFAEHEVSAAKNLGEVKEEMAKVTTRQTGALMFFNAAFILAATLLGAWLTKHL